MRKRITRQKKETDNRKDTKQRLYEQMNILRVLQAERKMESEIEEKKIRQLYKKEILEMLQRNEQMREWVYQIEKKRHDGEKRERQQFWSEFSA